MTEDEAKTKWCPFVRVLVTQNDESWYAGMLTNRGTIPADNTDTLCIASECMAWRWSLPPKLAKQYKRYNERGVTVPDSFGRPWPEVASGHCGLAGRQ